jgi:hypothetical protein
MWKRALWTALGVILGASLVACGGDLGGDGSDSGAGGVGSVGSGGSGGSGGPFATGGVGGETFCGSPLAPTLDVEVTCASFVPALMPSEVVFVERTEVAGAQAHRFRSTSDCGFDVVLTLPNLVFVADDAPYEMSTWWIQGSVPLGLLAVVLRRAGDPAPLLALAADDQLDLLNGLIAPLSIRLSGPPCGTAGLVHPALLRDESPLPCEVTGENVICDADDIAYLLTTYFALPGSTDVPAMLADADLVEPIVR